MQAFHDVIIISLRLPLKTEKHWTNKEENYRNWNTLIMKKAFR